MSTSISSYPRETDELTEFDHVTIKGEPAESFKYAIAEDGARPPAGDAEDGWLDPVDVDEGKAFRINGLSRGGYTVWAKVDTGTQHVVIEAGQVWID